MIDQFIITHHSLDLDANACALRILDEQQKVTLQFLTNPCFAPVSFGRDALI